jgi:alginate O-acetyltransferase complex protein AlgF
MKFSRRLAAAFFLSALAWPALADEALYDPVPPPDSAFVRIIDAGAAAVNGTVGGKPAISETSGVSPYQIVPKGKQPIRIGDVNGEIEIAPAKFYTIALMDGKLTTFEDPSADTPGRAGIVFYNLADAPGGSVYVPKLKVAVVEGVAPGATASKIVKAVTLDKIEIKLGDQVVAAFDAVALRPRSAMTAYVAGKAGAYKAYLMPSTTAKN